MERGKGKEERGERGGKKQLKGEKAKRRGKGKNRGEGKEKKKR